MPDEATSPTPDQLWEKAAEYLEFNETEGAQKSLLLWAMLLDAGTKTAWLDRLPRNCSTPSRALSALPRPYQKTPTTRPLPGSQSAELGWIGISLNGRTPVL